MKIARVELAPFALPLVAELRTGSGTHRDREGFALRLATDAGLIGLGEATPLPRHGTEALAEAGRKLREAAAALVGARFDTAQDVEAFFDATWISRPAARCGLEVALLDALARERGLPLAALLTANLPSTIALNALLTADSIEALAAQARACVDHGFRTLKLKVGAASIADDVARIRAVRQAAGRAVALRVDANGAWALATAQRALEEISEAAAIELCEQPVATLEAMQILSRESPIAIAADELLADRRVAEQLIASRAAHAVVLKPMLLGGILPALELGRRASAAGLEVIVSTALDGALARAAALHLAFALPGPLPACGLWTGALLTRDLAHEPIHRVGGRALAPTTAGLGVELRAALDWTVLA